MKYKLKFRIAPQADTEGKNSKKYSVSVEDGQSFTLGKYVPGVSHPIAGLAIREGCVHASSKVEGEDLDVSGAQGREFVLKPNDILKSGGYVIEFLEVPHQAPQPAPTETQVLDLNTLSAHEEATRVGDIQASEPENEPTRLAPAPRLSEEAVHEMPTSMMTRPEMPESHDEATQVRPRHERRSPQSEERRAPSDRRASEDRNFNVRRPSPVAMEITAMLTRKPQDASQDRYQIVASVLMLFLASGLGTGIGGFGSPLLGGAIGTAGFAGIAYLLHSLKHITTTDGDFLQHLRFVAIAAFGLVPWAYVYKVSPIGSIFAALVVGGGFYFGLSSLLKAEVRKAGAVAATLSAIPVLVALATPGVIRGRAAEEAVAVHDENIPTPETTSVAHNPPLEEQRAPASEPSTQPVQQAQPVPPIQSEQPAQPVVQPEQPIQAVAPTNPISYPAPIHGNPSEVPDALGTEELFTAIRAGNLKVVRDLVLTGAADPNFNLERGSTPLMIAAQKGNLKIVEFLLSRKVALDAKDPSGTTALMWAVLKDRYAIAKLLLAKGANPNISRDNGQTALDIAKRWNNRMMISLLEGERVNRSLAESKPKKTRRSNHSYRTRKRTTDRSHRR